MCPRRWGVAPDGRHGVDGVLRRRREAAAIRCVECGVAIGVRHACVVREGAAALADDEVYQRTRPRESRVPIGYSILHQNMSPGWKPRDKYIDASNTEV